LVGHGEEIIITRHRKVATRLAPPHQAFNRELKE